jgi:hypothetical protein
MLEWSALQPERGEEKMHIMQVSTHSPESCPMFNEETGKKGAGIMQAMEPTLAKHGIKLVGIWEDRGTHTGWAVYDTPSLDDFWACLQEPDLAPWVSFNSVENHMVDNWEEIKAMMMRH